MKSKRTEIVIELDEVFVIRRRQTSPYFWCGRCREQVQMITPDEAATLTGLSWRVIYRWVEAGRIHFTETGDGHLLICRSSLPKLIDRE